MLLLDGETWRDSICELVLLEGGTGSVMDLCYLYLDFTNVLGVVDGETDIDTLIVETGSVFVVILFETSR